MTAAAQLIYAAATTLLNLLGLYQGEPIDRQHPLFEAKRKLKKAYGGRLPDEPRSYWKRLQDSSLKGTPETGALDGLTKWLQEQTGTEDTNPADLSRAIDDTSEETGSATEPQGEDDEDDDASNFGFGSD